MKEEISRVLTMVEEGKQNKGLLLVETILKDGTEVMVKL